MMIVFFVLASYLLILAPLRMWATVHLMFTMGPVILVMTYLSRIWWVEAAGWIFFVLITLRIGQKVKMRLDGSYREFYRARQWQ